MSILAVIVAYRPDVEKLRTNLEAFAPWVDRVLLWKNSPFDFAHEKVVEAGDGTNRGISVALNAAAEYAAREGFD